jgi:predicted nucleotidyltransferase component of viral defense system
LDLKLPLANRLRRRAHRDVAELQDEVVEILYAVFPEAKLVLHGGTAVWRCFEGNRFSEDLDFYGVLPGGVKDFEGRFRAAVETRGLRVAKFKATSNVVFAKVADAETEIRVELNVAAADKARDVAVGAFEKTDGGALEVFVLPARVLLEEKMAAFQSRRLVRDVYDVFFLSRDVDFDAALRAELKKFVDFAVKNPPLDEENLEVLVYSGAAPSFKQMLDALRSRAAAAAKT